MSPLLSLVLGCSETDSEALLDEDTAIPTSAGWTVGDEQTCDAPLGEASWVDASGEVTAYPEPESLHGATEPGALAVVEVDGTWWMLWARPEDTVRARNLSTGEIRDDISTGPAGGFGLADLDADGRADLLMFGPLKVIWAFGTEDETTGDLPGETSPREAGVADLDGDGDLDLTYLHRGGVDDEPESMRPEVAYNQGDRTFSGMEDVSGDVGLFGAGFDMTMLDLNDDAAPDAYLCNDHGPELAPNLALVNDGSGVLVPTDVLGLDLSGACMGTAWGDPDCDGDLDVYVGTSGNHHLLTDTEAGYVDSAAADSLVSYPSPRMPWGSAFTDLENDGSLDLVVGSGCFRAPGMERFPAWWFHQDATGFVDQAADRRFAQDSSSRGVVLRDVNGDGVPDVFLSDAIRSPWVYLSEGCTADAWLEVEGPIGSRVTVESGGMIRGGLLTADSGWASAGTARLHFGLGDAPVIDRVTLYRPWGDPVVLEGPITPRRRVTWLSQSDAP